ncbi:DEAD/DEAH box helicase [Phytomonospora sp. NPDC050363]|uniref:DEAD/DEAH box helicase n=1 Tax=Phytomonospora sp. NPDC050363 TaxID=3155642 RepID=UPI0033C911C3
MALPPTKQLQATFLPDTSRPSQGRMAWWGGEDTADLASRRDLPEGAPGWIDLALPESGGTTVARTPARLVPLTQAVPALAAMTVAKQTSDSLLVWRAAAIGALGDGEGIADLVPLMPPAAHAVSLGEATAWSAGELLTAFRHAVHDTYASPTRVPDALLAAQSEMAVDAPVEAVPRPYQRHGIAWLGAVAEHGAGGLLADDMGLGKTLQTIALLAARVTSRPHLVVCPTSVVGNWARELARFAPKLPVIRHHGSGRAGEPGAFAAGSVVITSYSLLLRDVGLLSAVDWETVVLDEAQQIKNHTAQTARAARRIPARTRIALTGTPVENRLTELWSIMDFANPGLLGPHPRFAKRFAEPIELRHDPGATTRLRELISPYLLRRLKSEVATDLPDKLEWTVACTLTAEQARLYKKAVTGALDAGLGEGFERHGRVLALLTKLKQICNHPAQFLGEKDAVLGGRSGKLDRVTEMLGEVVAVGDRALVFTQYRAMGELLAGHLSAELGLRSVPFLHGGVTAKGREAMVDAFQDGSAPPILLVSLKAGGTGLNLTAANHVVHYDRWWNPAVEDQATDRAHRIGQKRRVDVHKLVTGGTLEERVAELLERKRSLADAIVGTGEDWITRLDDAGLRALIELSEVEVGE